MIKPKVVNSPIIKFVIAIRVIRNILQLFFQNPINPQRINQFLRFSLFIPVIKMPYFIIY